MSTNETTSPNTDLDALKARYPHVRGPVVAALHLLLQDPNISLDDAKSRAQTLGVRITAASVAAANRLRERMDPTPTEPATAATAADAIPAPMRPARRPRAVEADADADALIRGVVAKLQAQGNAEAERIRASVRRAIELLTAALA